MIFSVKNQTGRTLVIDGNSVPNNSNIDIVPYWAYGNFSDKQSDVDGSNAGRSLAGTMIRDYVTAKHSLSFVSIAMPLNDIVALRTLLNGTSGKGDTHFFQVTTDMFDGVNTTYTMYSNNRIVAHVFDNLYKLSSPIVEK